MSRPLEAFTDAELALLVATSPRLGSVSETDDRVTRLLREEIEHECALRGLSLRSFARALANRAFNTVRFSVQATPVAGFMYEDGTVARFPGGPVVARPPDGGTPR